MLDRIKALPKPQDLSDLQARMDCLLKENGELRAKAEEGDALRKEVGELKNQIKVMEKEVKIARTERDKSKEVAQKVHGFLGYPGDVLNKAQLYDHSLKQPTTNSGIKMMRCMVNYGLKMEKTLKELHVLLHPTGAQTGTGRNPRSSAQHNPGSYSQPGVCNSSSYPTGSTAVGAHPGTQHGGVEFFEQLGRGRIGSPDDTNDRNRHQQSG